MGGRSAGLIGSPTAAGGGYSKQPRANFFMERKTNKAAGQGQGHDKYKRVIPSMTDADKMGPDSKSRSPLLYIQDHPAVRPDLCRVIICTTFLLASAAFWYLANCCGIIFLYFAASWTCLFFVLLVTSLIGFGLKVRAEEVKDTRREKCERSDASDTSRSIRFKDLLMLRSFRVIKYRECEEALEVAQAVSTLSSRIQAQSAAAAAAASAQPTTSHQHHPNCPHHQPTTPPPATYPPLPAQTPQQNHTTPPKHHNHHQPLRQQHIRHHHHHHSKSTATPPAMNQTTQHQNTPQHQHRRQASVPALHPQHPQPLSPQHQQQQQQQGGDEGSLTTWFSRYQVQRNSGNVSGVVYEDDHGYHDNHHVGDGGEMMQTLTPNRS